MDCPSEESMIRMVLERVPSIHEIKFDLSQRQISVIHEDTSEAVLNLLSPLKLGTTLRSSAPFQGQLSGKHGDHSAESATLKVLLLINFGMFVLEFTFGWLAESTGLIADSFDMMADALVYGISLYVVGKSARLQSLSAGLSGVFQILLALFALSEVIRRYIFGSSPDPLSMIGISTLALTANVLCLYLISKHRSGGAHMKASWIFSANDVIVNIGVIISGILVATTSSRLPDLIIGSVIAVVVFVGAIKILRVANASVADTKQL